MSRAVDLPTELHMCLHANVEHSISISVHVSATNTFEYKGVAFLLSIPSQFGCKLRYHLTALLIRKTRTGKQATHRSRFALTSISACRMSKQARKIRYHGSHAE